MTIDMQGANVVPRIQQGNLTGARSVMPDKEAAGTDGPAPTFNSVLMALDTPAGGGSVPDFADSRPVGRQAGDVAEPGSLSLPSDPALLLAQSLVQPYTAALDTPAVGAGALAPSAVLPFAVAASPKTPDLVHERGGSVPGSSVAVAIGNSVFRAIQTGSVVDPATAFRGAVADSATEAERAHTVLQRGERDRYIARSEGLVDGVADGAGADASQAVAEGARADWRTALDVQVDRMAARNAPVPQEAGGGFKTLPALRSTERQSGRSVFVPVDGSLGSAGAASTYLASATTGTGATATADAPFAAGSSSEVAQKVHYWVTRGVQNAELQLDAFAGGAVDVSISMLGNEAQVEFRSDQPEARKMLQDAMPQLREMLRSEGLELSGGFVGTSAQRDSQARRDGPNTAAGRVATIVVPDQTTTRTLQSPAMQTRALDVFV